MFLSIFDVDFVAKIKFVKLNVFLPCLHPSWSQSAFPYRTPQKHFIVKKKLYDIQLVLGKQRPVCPIVWFFSCQKKKIHSIQINQLLKDIY